MRFLKKLAGGNANQNMHNNEDTRVSDPTGTKRRDQKGRTFKDKAAQAGQVAKRIPYYSWLWEKAVGIWDWIYEYVASILEEIS